MKYLLLFAYCCAAYCQVSPLVQYLSGDCSTVSIISFTLQNSYSSAAYWTGIINQQAPSNLLPSIGCTPMGLYAGVSLNFSSATAPNWCKFDSSFKCTYQLLYNTGSQTISLLEAYPVTGIITPGTSTNGFMDGVNHTMLFILGITLYFMIFGLG